MNKMKLIIGLITILFFGAIFTVAYTGNGNVCFSFLKYIPGGDKTGHVILLCVLAVILTWISSFRSFEICKVRIYYGIFSVFIFITIEEFLQILSPHRSYDLIDLACNYTGVILASIIMRLYKNPNQRLEPIVLKRSTNNSERNNEVVQMPVDEVEA